MTDTTPWTIGQLLKWTTDYLKDHGAESPRLDAEVLLAHARGCQRIDLYTRFDELADDELRNGFRALVKRRAAGTPVAYLVGHREFYSKLFRVTPDVLIPRPETEFVLVGLLDLVKSEPRRESCLSLVDVGTGSGNLAICAALQLPHLKVTAVDTSDAALVVARSNAQQHRVADRIRFLQSDLLDSVDPSERFDYIISNPPYIGRNEMASLPRDVVNYEPHAALFAGALGLDVLQRLIALAGQRLVPGGWLLSEFNPAQATALQTFVAQHSQLERPQFVDDLTRRPRVIKIRRKTTE